MLRRFQGFRQLRTFTEWHRNPTFVKSSQKNIPHVGQSILSTEGPKQMRQIAGYLVTVSLALWMATVLPRKVHKSMNNY